MYLSRKKVLFKKLFKFKWLSLTCNIKLMAVLAFTRSSKFCMKRYIQIVCVFLVQWSIGLVVVGRGGVGACE